MIIWGSRTIFWTVSVQTFFCPHDQCDQSGAIRVARRWFTFFFIPIFPYRNLGEFVECTNCGSTYEKDILSLPTEDQTRYQFATAVVQAMVAVMWADGAVSRQERNDALQILSELPSFADLDLNLEGALTQFVSSDDALGHVVGARHLFEPEVQEAVMGMCVRIAASDGPVGEEEFTEVMRVGLALGMSKAHIEGTLAQNFGPQILSH